MVVAGLATGAQRTGFRFQLVSIIWPSSSDANFSTPNALSCPAEIIRPACDSAMAI